MFTNHEHAQNHFHVMLTLFCPKSQAAIATIVRYMEVELGRKAVQAINMPVLSNRNHNISRATLGPITWFTALDRNFNKTSALLLFILQLDTRSYTVL